MGYLGVCKVAEGLTGVHRGVDHIMQLVNWSLDPVNSHFGEER